MTRLALKPTNVHEAGPILEALKAEDTLMAVFSLEHDELTAYGTGAEILAIEDVTTKVLNEKGLFEFVWTIGEDRRYLQATPEEIGKKMKTCPAIMDERGAFWYLTEEHSNMTMSAAAKAIRAWKE